MKSTILSAGVLVLLFQFVPSHALADQMQIDAAKLVNHIAAATQCYDQATSVFQKSEFANLFPNPEDLAWTYRIQKSTIRNSGILQYAGVPADMSVFSNHPMLLENDTAMTIEANFECVEQQISAASSVLYKYRSRNWYPHWPQNLQLTQQKWILPITTFIGVLTSSVVGHLSYILPGLIAGGVAAFLGYEGTHLAQAAYEISTQDQEGKKASGLPPLSLQVRFDAALRQELRNRAAEQKRDHEPQLTSQLYPDFYNDLHRWLDQVQHHPEILNTPAATSFWCNKNFN